VSSVAVDGDVITSRDESGTTLQWSLRTFQRLDTQCTRSAQERPNHWSYSGATVFFTGDPDCVGLTLDGSVEEIATDGSGNCIAFDSVQRLRGPQVLEVVPK